MVCAGNIALFVDPYGLEELSPVLPKTSIRVVVASNYRPQYFTKLGGLCRELGADFLIQPRSGTVEVGQFVATLKQRDIQWIFCFSYSMLIPREVLRLAPRRSFNIHSSLLPKNRGPNPLQWALIKGETQTGITLHELDGNVDHGPIVAQIAIPILESDSWITLKNRVVEATPSFLASEVPKLFRGSYSSSPQDESLATKNTRLTPESPRINFGTMSDWEIHNLIRAQVAPLRGAYLEKEGKRVYFPQMISLSEIARLRSYHGS